jgi:hypothetical protein
LAAAFLKKKFLNHEVTLLYIWYKGEQESMESREKKYTERKSSAEKIGRACE